MDEDKYENWKSDVLTEVGQADMMQVFMSQDKGRDWASTPPDRQERIPLIWDGNNLFIGTPGLGHYDLTLEFRNMLALWDSSNIEGMAFPNGSILWNLRDKGYGDEEPKAGVNDAVLDALGMSNSDFKFSSWNRRMR